ncbi:MAG: TauD/TfdA family dioxygenase [Microcoleus sp. PH2017_31_RDM_U_A]|nr:TauD/TfdA family dioxygenase [Microcoleus sp. PH2017_09_SFU_O_A]MCC3564358.1 TauD/TfdA family dioxygenase [Microcoleus sp. PH2017_31_RDM_U_A]
MTKFNLEFCNMLSAEKHKFEYKYLLKRFGSIGTVGRWIRKYVDRHGFIILQGLESESYDLSSAKLFLTKLSSHIGTLVPHNLGQSDFVWEIKPKSSISQIVTFSEHNKAAPLHTDSQYRKLPEKYMALLVFRQAECAGGETLLLDFNLVFNELKKSYLGRQTIEFACKTKFPIAVPTIFQTQNKTAYIYSSLISDIPMIRYRYDTLKTGLELIKHSHVKDFEEKLQVFNDLIHTSRYCSSLLLNNGEAIFVYNHRMLHGRSPFLDSNRLLLRIRMN